MKRAIDMSAQTSSSIAQLLLMLAVNTYVNGKVNLFVTID